MKWFKHFTDNHRGQSVQTLLDELGHMGLCYFLLVEMCAEKLESKVDLKLAEVDCEFNFHRRVVQQNLRIRPAGLQRLLNCCATTGLLTFEFTGNSLKISMPILLDLLDSDSKKARSRRASAAEKSRLDKDKDKDKEREKSAPEVRAVDPQFSPQDLFDLWNQNRGPLPEAEKLTDKRKASAKAQIKRYPNPEHWALVIKKMVQSQFCIEEWKPGFDDLLNESKRTRALEGKYDNKLPAIGENKSEDSWYRSANLVLLGLKKYPSWLESEAEVKSLLGDELFAIARKANTTELRRIPAGPFHISNVITRLKDAQEALSAAGGISCANGATTREFA